MARDAKACWHRARGSELDTLSVAARRKKG